MKHHEILAVADATTAMMIAVGFVIAGLIYRERSAFRWWAGSFALLAVSVFTATLRLPAPAFWAQSVCWISLYAAISLILAGLGRSGRARPIAAIAAGALLLGGIVAVLAIEDAQPPAWFTFGPIPSVLLLAWAIALPLWQGVERRFEWLFNGMLAIFASVIIARSVVFAGLFVPFGGMRPPRGMLPPPPRWGGGPGPELGLRPELGLPRPPGLGHLALVGPPPIAQPLIISMITIVALIGLAIALVVWVSLPIMERLRELSAKDGLTGLFNRRTFDERGEVVLENRNGLPVCAILLDIDHFKRVNDQCGHAAGDRVIARLGTIIGDITDERQIAGRIGGEEFAILLGGANLAAARLFAETIRTQFAASDFGREVPWQMTLSAGVALRAEGEHLRGLIARADKALYAAKNAGRNCVVVDETADAVRFAQSA